MIVRYHGNVIMWFLSLYIAAQPKPYERNLYRWGITKVSTHIVMFLFVYSTKSGNCLSCDQSTWGLPSTEQCNYFTASCDSAVQLCLLHCEGVAVLTWSMILSLHNIPLGPSIPYSILMKYDGEKLSPGNPVLLCAILE